MLRILTFTLSICIGLTFASCEKETIETSLLSNKWEAKSLTTNGTIEPTGLHFLEFLEEDGSYTLSLDVNNCGGEYALSGEDRIIFKFLSCSEACCDSSFATKMSEALTEITTYEVINKMLKLRNEDRTVEISFGVAE